MSPEFRAVNLENPEHRAMLLLEDTLDHLTELSVEQLESRLMSRELLGGRDSERISLTLDAIYTYVLAHRGTYSQAENITKLLSATNQDHGQFSLDNFTKYLSFKDKILFGMKISCLPECQDTLSPLVVYELVEHIIYSFEKHPDLFPQIYKQLKPSEQIAFLLFSRTILSHILRGDDSMGPLFAHIFNFIGSVADSKQAGILEKIVASKTHNDMEFDFKQIWEEGEMYSVYEQGRITTKGIKRTHWIPPEKIQPQADAIVSEKIARISKDAIASFDNAGLAYNFAIVPKNWNEASDDAPLPVTFHMFQNLEHKPEWVRINKPIENELDITLLLQQIYHPDIYKTLEKMLGIRLEKLSLREQLRLLAHLVKAPPTQQKDVVDTIRKFGLPAARAFLACEYGPQTAEAIIGIAKKLGEPVAHKVFRKYAELVDATEQTWESLIQTYVKPNSIDKVSQDALIEQTLLQGQQLLEHAYKSTTQPDKLLTELNRYTKESVLFGNICRLLFKGRTDVGIEEMRHLSLHTTTGDTLSFQDAEAMRTLSNDNWKHIPSRAELIQTEFNQVLTRRNPETEFFLLKEKGSLVGCIRFEPLPNGSLYAGSLNIKADKRGIALGDALINATINEKAKSHTLSGYGHPDSPITSAYIEKYGFVVTGFDAMPHDPTDWDFVITRNDTKNAHYQSKKWTAMELKKKALNKVNQNNCISFPIDLRHDKPTIRTKLEKLLQKGYVITRYIKDQTHPVHYIALENVTPTETKTAI